MKRLSLFLGLSLLCNALLVGLALSSGRSLDAKRSAQNNASPSAILGGKETSIPNVSPTSQAAPENAKLWDALDTKDLSAFVARLRAGGFPEKLIRILVWQRVQERFEPRLKEFRLSGNDLPYWQSGIGQVFDAKSQAERQKVQREMEQTVTDVLGKPEDAETAYSYGEPWRTDFLPPEKIKAMQKARSVLAEFYRKELDRPRKPGEEFTKEEQAKYTLALQRQQDDIAKLLTPAELAEYNLRNSATASILIQDLKNFRPTEAEYRALYPVYDSAYEQLKKPAAADDSGWTPSSAQTLRTSKQAQIQAVLGPERYADYLQATEPNASKLNMITERLGLPLSAAAEVTSVEKDITQRAQEIQKNATLTTEQKTQQITALSTEAEVAITTVLGTDGFGAYKQYSGSWLGKLQGGTPTRKP